MGEAMGWRLTYRRDWLTGVAAIAAVATAMPLSAVPACAQKFPSKMIRIISPAAAGGLTDVLARSLADELARGLGQTVIVENRPGAGGNIGTDYVAKSDPDGHTLLLGTAGMLVINEFIYSKIPFDPATAFEPITLVADMPLVLTVHPKAGVSSVAELVAKAKQPDARLSFGLSNPGGANHLALLLFERSAGVKVAHVPYRGAAPAAQDLLAGQIDGAFINPPAVMANVQAGALKVLAVVADTRMKLLPQVPTLTEAGVPGVFTSTWYALAAPAKTPKDVIALIHAETVKALRKPELIERFAAQGADLIGNTPEAFAAFVKQERAKWGPVVRELNLKMD
jgi:tripartite-type tricarboxylate transporter receptor subunit TctC